MGCVTNQTLLKPGNEDMVSIGTVEKKGTGWIHNQHKGLVVVRLANKQVVQCQVVVFHAKYLTENMHNDNELTKVVIHEFGCVVHVE